ncbi:MAG TPA: ABC transporter permease subunit [Polyangiaceae bacterium]|nr:ABC transporter permease subunit [Polyangiaceae bacterium]
MSAPVALPGLPNGPGRISVLLRLELADAVRSRWVAFSAATYLVAFGAFVWLGLRESSVLGFTGITRVVLNASNAIVVLLPLVSLVATCQAVVRARANGTFELFLSQPCERRDWFVSLLASRLLLLITPLVVVLGVALAAGLLSSELEPGLVVLVARALTVGGALVFAFTGIGIALSTFCATGERAIVLALLAWLAGVALHDFALIGLLLEMRVRPELVFVLTALNPVEASRLALLSAFDPELGIFGPVGFWIANELGPNWTFVLGVTWPFVLGSAALGAAWRKFHRRDLVG